MRPSHLVAVEKGFLEMAGSNHGCNLAALLIALLCLDLVELEATEMFAGGGGGSPPPPPPDLMDLMESMDLSE